MGKNLLIPLTGFTLTSDFPSRVGFTAAVDEHLHRMRARGHYAPGRFFGYYLEGETPMALCGSWTVALEMAEPWAELTAALDRLTQGRFSIVSETGGAEPEFLLVHDRRDGACWLWNFNFGMRFVSATEAVERSGSGGDGDGASGNEGPDRKLLGP